MKLFKIKHSVKYWLKQYYRLWKIKIELENNGYYLDKDDKLNEVMWLTLGEYCDALLRSIKK